jgi:hypothetical protein
LHGDRHGVQKIPVEIARDLPGVVSQIAEREAKLIRLCNEPGFSIERLAEALRR